MTRSTFLKMLVLGGGLALAGMAGGCSSTSSTDPAGPNIAVLSPKGDTVWVRDNRTGGTIVRMTADGAQPCPHCEKMATAYLNGDKTALKHCAACKGTPSAMLPGGRNQF